MKTYMYTCSYMYRLYINYAMYLVEATNKQVQVAGDLVEAMAAKHLVDELH